jgi:N-acetylglucosamine repressor
MSIQVAPVLLRKINERRVLETIQQRGPMSRAAVKRLIGMSAPTVSKAVASLLGHGLLEERGQPEAAFGRPGKLLRLASYSAGVLGAVIDARRCWVLAAGLDGKLLIDKMRSFDAPVTYPELISAVATHARQLSQEFGSTARAMGISVPGLVNSRNDQVIFSPNLHLLDGHRPAADLAAALGLDCVMIQESHALCLGECMYGEAKGRTDFAILDVSTGLGLGVMSGGRLLTGHSGLAGEFGHITIEPRGIQCGCGNHGCLETVATDSAFVRLISQKLGRPTDIDEALARIRSGAIDAAAELDQTCEYLAIAVAAVINTFNPSTLFVHGRLFDSDDNVFSRMVARAKERTLRPSFEDCQVLQARASKRQGAIAGVIHHLTNSWAPSVA